MEIHVSQQAAVFLWTVAGGVLSGLVYDMFRIVRRLFRTPDWAVFLCDTVFWLASSIIAFVIILKVNSGQIRWFQFAGLIIGGAIYFSFLSQIVTKAVIFVLRIIVKTVIILKKLLAIPKKILAKPLGFVKKRLSRGKMKIKKRSRHLKSKLSSELKLLKKVRKTS